ncbi:L,D-transpeptidase [Breoghania sp. JC706]|uniref:L,D-transpeptidase n=1 Tax=Breoghania sp. JC706 TaxID=3117732 RepID=UPI003009F252
MIRKMFSSQPGCDAGAGTAGDASDSHIDGCTGNGGEAAGSLPGVAMVSRRALLAGLALTLAGCASSQRMRQAPPQLADPRLDPAYRRMYGAIYDDAFPVPAVDLRIIPPQYLRQFVDYPSPYHAGTIVVDPQARFLYLVYGNGKAMRYGVGVGREGFGWTGTAEIKRKEKWPTWTPPKEMVERDPRVAPYKNGMPGGLGNPLGARALYLFQGNKDTLYRIHGTNEPGSIGKAVSSGCIRLLNQDIIDLYDRVPLGSPVVVLNDADAGITVGDSVGNTGPAPMPTMMTMPTDPTMPGM